ALRQRQKLAPLPHAFGARREARAAERLPRSLRVVADEQRLAGGREVVRLAGRVMLAGERAFEMRYKHDGGPNDIAGLRIFKSHRQPVSEDMTGCSTFSSRPLCPASSSRSSPKWRSAFRALERSSPRCLS